MWLMFNNLILKEGMEIGCFYEGEEEISERKFLFFLFFFFFFCFGKGFEEIKAVAFVCVLYEKFLLTSHLVQPV